MTFLDQFGDVAVGFIVIRAREHVHFDENIFFFVWYFLTYKVVGQKNDNVARFSFFCKIKPPLRRCDCVTVKKKKEKKKRDEIIYGIYVEYGIRQAQQEVAS